MFTQRRLARKILILAGRSQQTELRFVYMCERVSISRAGTTYGARCALIILHFLFDCTTILRHAAEITPVEIAYVAHSMVMSPILVRPIKSQQNKQATC